MSVNSYFSTFGKILYQQGVSFCKKGCQKVEDLAKEHQLNPTTLAASGTIAILFRSSSRACLVDMYFGGKAGCSLLHNQNGQRNETKALIAISSFAVSMCLYSNERDYGFISSCMRAFWLSSGCECSKPDLVILALAVTTYALESSGVFPWLP